MTENKRFTVKGDGVNAYCVSDKLNIYPMPILCGCLVVGTVRR